MANLKKGDIVVYEDREYIVIDQIDESYVLEDADDNQITVDSTMLDIIEDDDLDESTKAADSIKGKANYSTSQMTASVVSHVSSMSPSDQTKFFAMVQSQYGANKDHGVGDKSAANKSSVQTHNPHPDSTTPGQMAGKVKAMAREDLEKLLQGTEGLSEEFKGQAAMLFEAAVNLRVAMIEEELEAKFQEKLDEELAELTETLEENICKYVSYAAEQWITENQVAIDNTLRTEVSESFMTDLFKLFSEYNFDIPESSVDIVEALTQENETLREQLNESIATNMELVEAVEEFGAETIFNEVSEGLALTQVEKLRKLIEDIEFDGDDEAYRGKITVVKEKYFSAATPVSKLNEEVEIDEVPSNKKPMSDDPNINRYVDAISRIVKR